MGIGGSEGWVWTVGGGPAGLRPLGRERRKVGGKFWRSSPGGGAELIRLQIGGSFGLL